ncbi:alpha/beta fold hydrolase [Dactylosporangium sp. CA-152071]|uniref:alpha/beta fold hydrolase n=1 Tax=Dactylosporangium sp. CA-152071 TaxID=3239933 RepID=UPI003D8E9B19
MTGPPVLFIHGPWLHASSWGPWIELFGAAGHRASAPGWPGHPDTVQDARDNPESIADHGIDDIVEHYTALIAALPDRPVLVGHSFGGIIAQRLLGQGLAAAAVAIDADRITGLLPALPLFRNPANRRKAVSLTAEQFRSVFGSAVSAQESAELYDRWSIPAPCRPLFEATAAGFDPHRSADGDPAQAPRGPLLLITGGGQHHALATRATDVVVFPDRGHCLTIDSRWRAVADAALRWLRNRSLSSPHTERS